MTNKNIIHVKKHEFGKSEPQDFELYKVYDTVEENKREYPFLNDWQLDFTTRFKTDGCIRAYYERHKRSHAPLF